MTALPMTSARRFSPLGPRGMSLSPDNSFRFFEDFYAVPSTASESNDGCLLYFVPKNGGRIFDVHINRLVAHVGAFDPVHLPRSRIRLSRDASCSSSMKTAISPTSVKSTSVAK